MSHDPLVVMAEVAVEAAAAAVVVVVLCVRWWWWWCVCVWRWGGS